MRYGFGVDVGGTTIKLAFFDREGTMLYKWEIPTNTANGGQEIMPDIAKAIRGYLEEHHISDDQIIGVGVGVPGPVDSSPVEGVGIIMVADSPATTVGSLPSHFARYSRYFI